MLIDSYEQQKALVHFYFQTDPDLIDFDKFAKLWGRLEFALAFEGKLSDSIKRNG